MILNNKPFEVIEHRGSSVIGKFKRNKQLIHVSILSLRHEMDVYPFLAAYKTSNGIKIGVVHRNNYQILSYKLNYIDENNDIKSMDLDNPTDYIPVAQVHHPNLIRTTTRDYLIANYDWVLAETTGGRVVGVYYRDTILTENGNYLIISVIKPVKRNAKMDYCPSLGTFVPRARIGRKYTYTNSRGETRTARDYRRVSDDKRFRLNNYRLC